MKCSAFGQSVYFWQSVDAIFEDVSVELLDAQILIKRLPYLSVPKFMVIRQT